MHAKSFKKIFPLKEFRLAYLFTKLFLLNVSNVSAADIDLVLLFFLCKEIFLTMKQLGVLLQLCYLMGKRKATSSFTRILQHTHRSLQIEAVLPNKVL